MIGAATHRVHNPYDIVPKAWNLGTLEEIPTLYDPVVHFPEVVKLALDALILLVEHEDYAQIRPDQPPLVGKLFPELTELAKQAGTQHTCGYLCGLEIADQFQPVMSDCQRPDPNRVCPPCP